MMFSVHANNFHLGTSLCVRLWRFHSHKCLIMMKPAHVNIRIIVYANRREYFCRQQQRQLAHKAFLCIFGVHRITNPRHIVYVNRFLTPSCFPPMSPPSMTTKRDVETWGIFMTELWSRVFGSKEKSVWRKFPRKKLINYWQQKANRSET